jgi:L-lactate dehydrogenase complex protein LldE
MLSVFKDAGVVVAPSGSCVAMVRDAFGDLDLTETEFAAWKRLRERTFELSEFLVANGLHVRLRPRFKARVAVHRTCHHLRHAGGEGPLSEVLARVDGMEPVESAEARECCGFGGVFSMKLPELSVAMGKRRLDGMLALGPDVIALADAGCILHLRGIASAAGIDVPVVHYAQLLSDTVLPAGGRRG